jgi:hypothetical protein
MLEMILSSEKGRLSERITKFLVTQVIFSTWTVSFLLTIRVKCVTSPPVDSRCA